MLLLIIQKIIVLSLVLSHIIIRLYKGLKHGKEKKEFKKLPSQQKTILIIKDIIVLPLGLLLIIAWLINEPYAIPIDSRSIIELTMGIILAGGSSLLMWASFSALEKNWSRYMTVEKNHQLIQHGPYKFIRHPMYSSYLLLAVSLCLLTNDVWISVITFAYFGLNAIRAIWEEKRLAQQYHEDWNNYKQKTKRFIP